MTKIELQEDHYSHPLFAKVVFDDKEGKFRHYALQKAWEEFKELVDKEIALLKQEKKEQ